MSHRKDDEPARAIFPGLYEPREPLGRAPGTISGPLYDSEDQPVGNIPMDAETIADREREGGGQRVRRSRP